MTRKPENPTSSPSGEPVASSLGASGSAPSLDDTHAATHDGVGATGGDAAPRFEIGESVGRYVVVGKLGAGAMGVVYIARDPELDRNVALKVLRPRDGLERGEVGQRKLLAEAQALARIADPNVVSVFDVGASAGGVFVAMELIEGDTLRGWCSASPRSWRELLGVLVQVGKGVAAVHASELVHRDLKPDNVMIGRDGRVRVMDFGLARAGSVRRAEGSGDAFVTAPLAVGAFVGTPSYCAPEQLSGRRVTAAADQFSFCVTAWEALHGRRPFVADSVPGLVSRMLGGEIEEPPVGHARPPRWLRKILRRGLAAEPSARWPSMSALVTALDRGRTRAKLTAFVIVLSIVLLGIAAIVGWQRYARHRLVRQCETAAESATAMWTAERGDKIATLVSNIEASRAGADDLVPSLERRARALRDEHVEVCTATTVEGTWDSDLAARARWCLEIHAIGFAALLDRFDGLDARTIDRAIETVNRPSTLDTCGDPVLLADVLVPPESMRAAVDEVGRMLARSAAHGDLGDYTSALAIADEAVTQASEIGWLPSVAEARIQSAWAHSMVGELDDVEASLETAYFEASRAGANQLAAAAASHLVDVVGEKLARPADALRWTNHLEVALLRVADTTAIHNGTLAGARASINHTMGKLDDAKAYYEQAIAEIQARRGVDDPDVIDTQGDYAGLLSDLGDHTAALAVNESVLAARRATLAPGHAKIAMSLNNRARDLRAVGRTSEAIVDYERAIAIWEASIGPDHLYVAQALNNLANAVTVLGDLERAETLHTRALAIRERAVGSEHPAVAQTLVNLASLAYQRLDFAGAHAKSERGLAILEASLGTDHPQAAMARFAMGKALAGLGQLEASEAALRRSGEILDASSTGGMERAGVSLALANTLTRRGSLAEAAREIDDAERRIPVDNPMVSEVWSARADLAGRARDFERANAMALEALARWATATDTTTIRAISEFQLAHWLTDPARAREVASNAREVLAASQHEMLPEIDAWLAGDRPYPYADAPPLTEPVPVLDQR